MTRLVFPVRQRRDVRFDVVRSGQLSWCIRREQIGAENGPLGDRKRKHLPSLVLYCIRHAAATTTTVAGVRRILPGAVYARPFRVFCGFEFLTQDMEGFSNTCLFVVVFYFIFLLFALFIPVSSIYACLAFFVRDSVLTRCGMWDFVGCFVLSTASEG